MFSPNPAVPAFPGAINNCEHKELWLIFHENACSLPPDPSIRMFKLLIFRITKKRVGKLGNLKVYCLIFRIKGYFENQEIYLFTVNQKNENPSYLFFYCKKLLLSLGKLFNGKNKHSFKFLLTLQPD